MAAFAARGIKREVQMPPAGQLSQFAQQLVTAHRVQISAAAARVKAPPRPSLVGTRAMNDLVLQARDLERHYAIRRGLFKGWAVLQALRGASFELHAGRTLAVVGKSGCGKSTLARLVTLIEPPSAGALTIDGIEVASASALQRHKLRHTVQIVFQDPYGSLNPRKKVGSIVEEPLKVNGAMSAAERRRARPRTCWRAWACGPSTATAIRTCSRAASASGSRSPARLMLRPKLVVLDEPVSALDVSVQAQVLNLLLELQAEFKLAYLFISPRSRGRPPHRRRGDRDVPRPADRAWRARPLIFERPAASLHPGPCRRAAPRPTPSGAPSGSRSGASCPSPLDPPAGCAFPRAARSPTSAAGPRCRSCSPTPGPTTGTPATRSRKVACPTCRPLEGGGRARSDPDGPEEGGDPKLAPVSRPGNA